MSLVDAQPIMQSDIEFVVPIIMINPSVIFDCYIKCVLTFRHTCKSIIIIDA